MPLGEGVAGDLYLRFAVEFPSETVAGSWSKEERKALQDLLPTKPKFPREKRVRGLRLFLFIPLFFLFFSRIEVLLPHVFALASIHVLSHIRFHIHKVFP